MFKLSQAFTNNYKDRDPDFGPLGQLVYVRSYSRLMDNGDQERFQDTCKRVVEGIFQIQQKHCKTFGLPWDNRKAQQSAQEMFKRMFSMKFVPPGRGLWALGSDFMWNKTPACLYNCGFRSTKDIDINFSAPFTWIFQMSLLGVGCGFDTEGAKKKVYLSEPIIDEEVHTVEDSREGWCVITERILDAFSGKATLPSQIDYSNIRPAGEKIKGFGGVCPGSQPLRDLVEKLLFHLRKYVTEDKAVDSTLIVDITNLIGAAVVAGGIRRTALIALGEISDNDFIELKSLDALQDPMLARWSSNNSLKTIKGSDYSKVAEQTAINGEPGYYWIDNARNYGRMKDPSNDSDFRVSGLNPCAEIPLEDAELCNICETFPSRHDSLSDYMQTLKYAYMYCKTVTLLPTHSQLTNQVQMRNRRIGVSQSGIVENIQKIGFREHMRWCDEGYSELKKLDKVYSEWLCVPTSKRLSTVKPSGSVSLLPQVTPGVHFPHSEYYIRRVRLTKDSDIAKLMERARYPVEPDLNQPDYTVVVSVPVKEKNFSNSKADVSMWQQLELAAQMQAYWSDNAVSVTVTIKPEEAKDLPRALEMYESRLKSVSFLPLKDHKYAQAPYEEIDKATYELLSSQITKVDLSKTLSEKKIERFCDGEKCEI